MNTPAGAAHGNAFDLLRLGAALAVLASHACALAGRPEPDVLGLENLGKVALWVFFALSGYLVAQSWQRDPQLGRFFARRLLRIVPGLAIVLLVTTLLLGPAMTARPLPIYFGAPATWQYLLGNLALFWGRDTLPGLFEGNPLPLAVNGSLWTLQYEVLMYGLLAFAALATRRLPALRWALVLGWLAAALTLKLSGVLSLPAPLVWRWHGYVDLRWLLDLGAFFVVGAALSLLRECMPQRGAWTWAWAWALLAVLVLLAIPATSTAPGTAVPITWRHAWAWCALPVLVLFVAEHAPRRLRELRLPDYSYGVYVYAFPVQQTLVALDAERGFGFAPLLACEVAVTMALAALSWHFVEKPALAFKPRRPGAPA